MALRLTVGRDGTAWSPKAVLIDLDGTLLDTIDDLAAAANAMRTDFGLLPLAISRVRDFIGKGAEVLVRRTLTDSMDAPLDPGRLAEALTSYRNHYALLNGVHARCFPGVREGLLGMRRRGLKLACVTNKPVGFTVPLLERTGLFAEFDVVVGGDSLPLKKPHPAPLLHACEGLQVSPFEALMIGDSGNDALAARAAGMPVFIVPYGYNEGHPVGSLDADAVVDSLEHALSLIPAQ